MPHEITRVLKAFATEQWFIEPRKAEQIVAMLELRAANGPRDTPYIEGTAQPKQANVFVENVPAARRGKNDPGGHISVISMYGPIVPRMAAVRDVSAAAVSMTALQKQLRLAAQNVNTRAIVLDIDSPGGTINLVPETAALIKSLRSDDRPIVAVANTVAASAAYWLASAANEMVVSPSAEVGSIGVYMMHEDLSEALAQRGVKVSFISAGPRKIEGNPFEPLGDEARAAFQSQVETSYDMFTRDVARARGVPIARVRADPEKTDRHFGGGRVVSAREAVDLGMADRIDTLQATIERLAST